MDILVVDDTKSVQSMLAELLTSLGHNVHTANNGLDALGKARIGDYQLFVIDHLMPLMDGIQLIRNFQKTPELENKKIIFITTQGIKSLVKSPEFILFDHVIEKPFTKDKFISVLSEVIDTSMSYETLQIKA